MQGVIQLWMHLDTECLIIHMDQYMIILLHSKVDMDVAGTENTFNKIDWTSGPILDALNSQDGETITEKPEYFLIR
eukprot:UN00544